MTDELRPIYCPFCGSNKAAPDELLGAASTDCEACGASGPITDTPAEAIAAWNQRALPAQIRKAMQDVQLDLANMSDPTDKDRAQQEGALQVVEAVEEVLRGEGEPRFIRCESRFNQWQCGKEQGHSGDHGCNMGSQYTTPWKDNEADEPAQPKEPQSG